MKTVKLVLKIDVEELPCCPPQIRRVHVRGVLTDENVVYVLREGKLYKRELADLKYDEAEGGYCTTFPVMFDEDIMTGHGFEEIKLSVDPKIEGVLKVLLT